MVKRIAILGVVLIGVCTFLSGCKADGEYSVIRKLRDILVTRKPYMSELESMMESIHCYLEEGAKAVRVGVLEEAGTENTSLQPEVTVSKEPEAEWFWLESGDDDSRFRPEGQAPFYECFDPETGEPVITLYYDMETKSGSGVSYGYGVDRSNRVGFLFGKNKHAKEAYRVPELLTYNGVPIEEDHVLINIQDYAEYDEAGNIVFYSYEGNSGEEYHKEQAEENALIKCEIRYFYREDGTLLKKEGIWDGREYHITSDSKICYFDELGRESWSYEYITHGSLHKYYIYAGDTMLPSYCFVFDSGWDAYMLEY